MSRLRSESAFSLLLIGIALGRRLNLGISLAILAVLAGCTLLLHRSASRERKLAQLQMDFVAGVSHELRTPLSAAWALSENLADGLVHPDPQVRHDGRLLREQARGLSEMVEHELLARIGALLRRLPTKSGEPLTSYRFGAVDVDFQRSVVHRGGEPVSLSAKEFQLLRRLIERRGLIISREQLLADVWGYNGSPLTRTADVHMLWLRQKLEANPKSPEFFLTIRGTGYKFVG